MSPALLLALQIVLILGGVVAAWFLAHRFLAARWAAIGWGMLAFPVSQILRLVVLVPVTALLPADTGIGGLLGAGLAVLSSGLFEESTRWLVLRHMARRTRSWQDGVGFGLGHGGIEAILVVGTSAVGGIVLLALAHQGVLPGGDLPPGAAQQLHSQVSALEALTGVMVGAGVYERALAIVLHVALSLLVLRGVVTDRRRLWLLAIWLHCAYNAVAVLLAPASPSSAAPGELLPLYAALTILSAVALWAVWRGPLSSRAFGAGPRAPRLAP